MSMPHHQAQQVRPMCYVREWTVRSAPYVPEFSLFTFQPGDRSHSPALIGDAYLRGCMSIVMMLDESRVDGITSSQLVATHMQRGEGIPFHTLSRT